MSFLILFLLVNLKAFGQEFKFFYNSAGELTIKELASHYRTGILDTEVGHFVDSVYEYRMDESLLSSYYYGNEGELISFAILNSDGSKALEFNSREDKWKKLPDSLKISIENKFNLKQSAYIRKNYYANFRSLLTSAPHSIETYSMMVDGKIESVPEIFTITEDPPEFPGGMNNLTNFLSAYITYPQKAKEDGIKGRVYVQFIILPDGTLTDVKVLRGIGYGCDEEAVKAVEKLPDWQPALQRGKPVSFRMILPIKFQ